MLKHFWYQDTIVLTISVLTHELRFNQQFNSKYQHATINHDHQMLREIGENDIIIYDIKAMEKKGWWLVNGPELGRLLIIISYFFTITFFQFTKDVYVTRSFVVNTTENKHNTVSDRPISWCYLKTLHYESYLCVCMKYFTFWYKFLILSMGCPSNCCRLFYEQKIRTYFYLVELIVLQKEDVALDLNNRSKEPFQLCILIYLLWFMYAK